MAGQERSGGLQARQAGVPFAIWERYGATEHLGGIRATQELARACHIVPGQRILDIGCGTGYTACYLAQTYQAYVVALDVTSTVLQQARQRAARMGVRDGVTWLRGDAHELEFPAETFDAVVLESVMVFCDARQVTSEIHRVLKPRGLIGDNELTLLKAPPDELRDLLTGIMGVLPLQRDEWREVFKQAGFGDISSAIYRMNVWDQLISHLKVDGLGKYLSAILQSTRDPSIRGTFFSRKMFAAARQFMPYIGYGLYVGQKGG
jgi:ubiquinone/menaquinone biosynthesis C-methylase UbiE